MQKSITILDTMGKMGYLHERRIQKGEVSVFRNQVLVQHDCDQRFVHRVHQKDDDDLQKQILRGPERMNRMRVLFTDKKFEDTSVAWVPLRHRSDIVLLVTS